ATAIPTNVSHAAGFWGPYPLPHSAPAARVLATRAIIATKECALRSVAPDVDAARSAVRVAHGLLFVPIAPAPSSAATPAVWIHITLPKTAAAAGRNVPMEKCALMARVARAAMVRTARI